MAPTSERRATSSSAYTGLGSPMARANISTCPASIGKSIDGHACPFRVRTHGRGGSRRRALSRPASPRRRGDQEPRASRSWFSRYRPRKSSGWSATRRHRLAVRSHVRHAVLELVERGVGEVVLDRFGEHDDHERVAAPGEGVGDPAAHATRRAGDGDGSCGHGGTRRTKSPTPQAASADSRATATLLDRAQTGRDRVSR